MRPGDELVLVGRFGSFVVPVGITIFAEGATIERAQVSDAVLNGGAWARGYFTGRATCQALRIDALIQSSGELTLRGVELGRGAFAAKVHAERCRGNFELHGEADLDDVQGDVMVTGSVRGTALDGALCSSGRVQLDRLTGRLAVSAGTVEVAEVHLEAAGDEPAVTISGGSAFLDAGTIQGRVHTTGGELGLGAGVVST